MLKKYFSSIIKKLRPVDENREVIKRFGEALGKSYKMKKAINRETRFFTALCIGGKDLNNIDVGKIYTQVIEIVKENFQRSEIIERYMTR